MGVADSPLRDRVIFVEGAPRSGTSMLAALLSAHPEVAGSTGESHLFDWGVGELFANHEGTRHGSSYLGGFVTREELAGLVRELCDGVLERMRARTRPEAGFLLEKTPAVRTHPEVALARKLECYPDAWYVHIVREPEAVTRSLMRAPWNPDRAERPSARWVRDGVAAIRQVLGDRERYREVHYEQLVDDPVAVIGELCAWLGLRYDDETRGRISLLSRERFSDFGPPGDAEIGPQAEEGESGLAPTPGDATLEERREGSALRTWLRRVRRSEAGSSTERTVSRLAERGPEGIGRALGRALRGRDAAALERLTAPSVALFLRSPEGDMLAEGDEAREGLLAAAAEIFGESFLSESWSVAPADPYSSVIFAGARPDGTRVDLWIGFALRGGRIVRVALLSAGDFGGRPLRKWTPARSA